MLNYKFAYLIGNLILFPVWIFLFFRRKDLRAEILTIGLLCAIVAPISDYIYIKDYWHPQTFISLFKYHGVPVPIIEDALFGFLFGGISSSIYEVLWGKKFAKRLNRKHHWSYFIVPMMGFFLLVLIVTVKLNQINSIYGSSIAFFLSAVVMLCFRPDLWRDSFNSGVLTGLVMVFLYSVFLTIFPEAIHKWWLISNISGVLFFGIPIEELIWGFSLGLMIGPFFEFFRGLRLQKAN